MSSGTDPEPALKVIVMILRKYTAAGLTTGKAARKDTQLEALTYHDHRWCLITGGGIELKVSQQGKLAYN
jgi:hypothetical protein